MVCETREMQGGLLGRIGSLATRLAETAQEIAAVQELRHRIFSCELATGTGWRNSAAGTDTDRHDLVCDHLIVIDTALPGPDHARIVGTYRLLRQERAALCGGFYSQDEFDIEPLIARHPGRRFLELGRSCVLAPYRSKRTIELLWQGIWAYSLRHGIDVMVGCASFAGTVPAAHALALTFLTDQFRAEPDWNVTAVANRRMPMDLMPKEAIDFRKALAATPALIKGYLRLGARVGDGCVIDHAFGSVDVFIVLPREAISERYIQYYGAEATRFAA